MNANSLANKNMNFSWEFQGDRIIFTTTLLDGTEFSDDLCERVEVIEKFIDFLTGNEMVKIKLYMPYAEKILILERNQISEKKLFDDLTHKGLSIFENTDSASILKKVLTDTEKESTIHFHHNEYGFQRTIDGRECFLGYHPIGNTLTQYEAQSTHKNEKRMKPKGSLNAWRGFVRKKIAKNAKLSLAILLGVSAPVAHILRENDVFTDIPLWAIIGETSSGKTTILHIVASLYANPRRYITTFNATTNAFFESIREKQGFPALIDEATHTPNFDWDTILYGIPDGREKMKCDSTGRLREYKDFSGAVIITSEKSILERSQGYGGQNARIIEFTEKWFDDKGEDAEESKLFFSQNYGWATEPIISMLMQDGFADKLGKRWQKTYRRLLAENDVTSGVDHRLLQRIALLLVSGWVFEKALKIGMHLLKLEKLLVNIYSESRKRYITVEPADELLNDISDYIVKNQERFPSEAQVRSKSCRYTACSLYGVRGDGCVWIVKSIFREIMKKQAKYGLRTACKKLEEKRYLKKYYDDRYVKKEDFGVVTTDFYCVLLPTSTSVLEKIEDIKTYDRTMLNANKAFNEDYYGAEDYSVLRTLNKDIDEKMILGFLRLSAQTMRLVINANLKKALALKASDRLYFLPVIGQDMLVIGNKKLIKDSPSCALSLSADKKQVFADNYKIDKILKLFNENIDLYNRLVLTDIRIESKNDVKVAVINMKNRFGRWKGDLCKTDPLSVDDINWNNIRESHIVELLSPEEENEE